MVFGCGYLGMRVAKLWIDAGHAVTTLTRSDERAAELRSLGFGTIVGDVTESLDLSELTEPDTVLYAVGFDRGAGHTIHDVYVGGMRNVLASLPPTVNRFIYISSTGVYGHQGGEWVDEDSTCIPETLGGKACLEAENVLAEHPLGARSVVLRLAGIYGPGRLPRVADVQAGRPLASNPDSFLNLIHVDDAASVVLAAEQRADPPRLYTVSDGQPVPRRDFYMHLAELLDVSSPRFEATGEPRGRDRSNKRVRNNRMLAEVQAKLQYPGYRLGLPTCL